MDLFLFIPLLEGGLVEGLLKANIDHTDQLLQGEDKWEECEVKSEKCKI